MKKLIPIMISIFVVLYLGAYLVLISKGLQEGAPFFVRLIMFLLGLAVAMVMGGMVATLIKRLKEIDKEDKDDLSKY